MALPGSGPDFPTDALKSAAMAFTPSSSPTPSPAPSAPAASSAPAAVAPPASTYSSSEDPATPVRPTSSTPAPSAAPVVAEGAAETPVPASEPQPIELDVNAHYRVKTVVNGKETIEVLTGQQVLQRQMNARKFTQEMQNLRAAERNLLQERQQMQEWRQRAQQGEEAAAVLNDPVKLTAHIQARFPHLTLAQAQQAAAQTQLQAGIVPGQAPAQAPSFDPDALSTLGDVHQAQQAFQSRVAQLEQELGRKLTAAEEAFQARLAESVTGVLADLARSNQVAQFDRQIDQHIEGLTASVPALRAIPDVNDLIRFKVTQMGPRTPDEMFEAINQVAQGIKEELDQIYQADRQQAIAAKAKLQTSGIEAPSGQSPTFQRKISHRGADGKFSWDSLKDSARARALMG